MAETTKNELQSFSSDFKAQTGKVVEDFSAGINNILSGERDSTSSRIVGGLVGINQTASEEDILVNYLQKSTFKVGLPQSVRDFPERVRETLETILDVLNTLKTVLESIRELIVGLSDLTAALLQSIFDNLEDLINMFASADGRIRALPIPPIHPSDVKANSLTVADKATTKAFADFLFNRFNSNTVLSRAFTDVEFDAQDKYIINSTINRAAAEKFLVGETGPNARYKDGSTGFLAAINDSFEDSKDHHRPVEDVGFSAGLVIQAGAPIAQINASWLHIKRILFNIKNELEIKPVRGPWPTAKIHSINLIGYSERDFPILQMEIDNPGHRAPKDLMSIPEEVYLPVELIVLGVQNTDLCVLKSEKERGYINLDTYRSISGDELSSELKNYTVYTEKYKNNLEAKTLSSLGLSVFTEQKETFQFELIHSNLAFEGAGGGILTVSPVLKPIDTLFKIRVSYKKFIKTSSGDYKEETFNENVAPKYYSLTQSIPLHISLDPDYEVLPIMSAGAAPNWIHYGKNWEIPGTEVIVKGLRDTLADLKSILSTTTNYLTSVINTYIKLIDKLTTIITRLNNIVYAIDKLLNTNIGANIVIFTSDNGVSGIKKAINDHYQEQQALYNQASSNNQSTSDIDWFADGESVCGGVIVATSRTAEQVDRLISLLTLLFGSSPEQNTSGQSIISSEVLGLEAQALELTGITFQPTVPKEIFTNNFTGISSDRHSESPENACDV